MSLKFTFKNINRVASSNVKRQILLILLVAYGLSIGTDLDDLE